MRTIGWSTSRQTGRGGRRPRTVEEVLKERGWKFVRAKKHIIYQRIHKGKRQVFTQAKTSSDARVMRNQLATLDSLERVADEHFATAGRARHGVQALTNAAAAGQGGGSSNGTGPSPRGKKKKGKR